MGEIRPDLSDQHTDTVGTMPAVTFAELGKLMLGGGDQASVTSTPAETAAPFEQQHDASRMPDRKGWSNPYEAGIRAAIRAAKERRQ